MTEPFPRRELGRLAARTCGLLGAAGILVTTKQHATTSDPALFTTLLTPALTRAAA